MTTVEIYYLIDYENVHEDGLLGSENMNSHDHVHLFYTENASKISIEKFANFHSIDFSIHRIPVGKQSLDMHLVSYLGYPIGKNESSNLKCKYIIVSNDTDYDNIIHFWKEASNYKITRQKKITIATSQTTVTKTNTTVTKNHIIANDSKKKRQLNTEVQRAISKAGYPKKTIGAVASIVVKQYGKNTFASNVHNELKNMYTDYDKLYKIVKPIIGRYS